ncbi:Uncharacterised protein [Serratia plymuthica]|uniref:Uncharacterized protein n=1 Tax=Serratia plymuthica TaxID=82996 RepID=A0A2X4XSN2_SERPL|nr:Uncharacterised protein [Serratia plymuthica]
MRNDDIGADARTVGVKHQALLCLESRLQFLIGPEIRIAGQQHFKTVVAVALAEQIGVVAEPFDHFAVEIQA